MAAKLRSKRCQEQTSVKQRLIDNQLGNPIPLGDSFPQY